MDQLDKFIDAQQKVGERLDKMIAETEDNLFMSELTRTKQYFENLLHEKRNINNGEIVFGDVRPIVDTLYKDGEIYETKIRGYEIDYYVTGDKPEGTIEFPKALLGKCYSETAANIRNMLYGNLSERQ
ncbi:hypothetical protein M3621_13815 [Bacillus safensis]|uniref:hypothetical protein n=1 Tax=Bacillus safensis TaxID=561879 RepID=UPI0020414C3B|nr:hypothetical protein [Bacillus safensis]MCM3367877.1 hypothetical protein [Bacillus safensis]